jgi:hypothetical protein
MGGSSYYRPWSVYPHFTSSHYAHYTLANAVARHLPPGYSDPQAYAQQLANQTGLDPNAQLGDLTPTQLASLTDAIDSNPNWAQSDTLPDIAPGASTQDAPSSGSGADYSAGGDFASATPTAPPSDNS